MFSILSLRASFLRPQRCQRHPRAPCPARERRPPRAPSSLVASRFVSASLLRGLAFRFRLVASRFVQPHRLVALRFVFNLAFRFRLMASRSFPPHGLAFVQPRRLVASSPRRLVALVAPRFVSASWPRVVQHRRFVSHRFFAQHPEVRAAPRGEGSASKPSRSILDGMSRPSARSSHADR
jgi:hypothetical protein